MTIKWIQGDNKLYFGNTIIPCSCIVRDRLPHEVVYTMPNKKPYKPLIFPVGRWQVGMPERRDQPDRAPWFIPTNAYRHVQVWALKDGKYDYAMTVLDKDMGYGLHCSIYKTTWGCIKIDSENDIEGMVKEIQRLFKAKQPVHMEVLKNGNY